MAPINVAILGSGIFAKTEHKPAVYGNPEVAKLIAVWSRRRAGVEAFQEEGEEKIDLYCEDDKNAGSVKGGLEELLAREELDGVIIALPILLQPEIIKKCILAGKHVLSEKPIAKDLESARELLDWYDGVKCEDIAGKPEKKPIWAVAENFRYQDVWQVARREVEKLGRVVGFRATVSTCVERGGKYFETEWRKIPSYQGGFLLDGGVHFSAALQLLLNNNPPPSTTATQTPDTTITRLSAYSTQLQPHLPPIDTLTSILTLRSGVVGSMHISFGTASFKSFEFLVACEGGSVAVLGGGKVLVRDEKGEVKGEEKVVQKCGSKVEDGTGVGREVGVWAACVARGEGKVEEGQRPVAAYNDLVLIETMIKSAEQGGQPLEVVYKA